MWILLMCCLAVWEGLKIRGISSLLLLKNFWEAQRQSTVKLQYTSQSLRQLGQALHNDLSLRRLNHDTSRTIKLLRINRTRIRLQRPHKAPPITHAINPSNLVTSHLEDIQIFDTMQWKVNSMTLNPSCVSCQLNRESMWQIATKVAYGSETILIESN